MVDEIRIAKGENDFFEGYTVYPLEFRCKCGYFIRDDYWEIFCPKCNREYERIYDEKNKEIIIKLITKENIPSF